MPHDNKNNFMIFLESQSMFRFTDCFENAF